MSRVLFITKQRELNTEGYSYGGLSSGLLNSATFMAAMLQSNHIEARVVQVIDNNEIDKEVSSYKPTHVFIEALWVVPSKFEVLTKLHPKVKWIVRLHSDVPFAAMEGIFMDWVFQYIKYPQVTVNVNSSVMYESLTHLIPNSKLVYLPNFYPVGEQIALPVQKQGHIDVGCFGAIRPLKNQLIQAVSAIKFGNLIDKQIRFHINIGRNEQNGSPVLRNIQNLFANQLKHKLVEHPWMPHQEFVKVIQQMDICMQMSFTETFNIVTADAVNENIPVVVSPAVNWISPVYQADPLSVNSQVGKLLIAYKLSPTGVQEVNKEGLRKYNQASQHKWLDYLAR